MKTLDKNNDGFVSCEEFNAQLKELNVFITKAEEHTLLRRFDTNGDGKVSMEEFYNCLASNF
jgi:Ca2+-binding EF-hand superfamily protein